MKKIVIIILGIVVLVSVVALGTYSYLGGFKEVEITTQTLSSPVTLAGTWYEGRMKNHKLGELFDQTKQLHKQGQLKGTLAAVYYDLSEAKRKQSLIKAFVGVAVSDTVTAIPKGYSFQTIGAKQVVQAHLTAHFLVSPSPDEVQEKMIEYARKNQLKTESLVIEKYLNDNSIILEIPIIQP